MAACGSASESTSTTASGSGDAAFGTVVHEYLEDLYRRQPTSATYLGIHKYDDRLENYSREAVMETITAVSGFRDRVSAIEPSTLSAATQLDREQLLHAIDSKLLTLDVIRP